jgi:hypothetical protein
MYCSTYTEKSIVVHGETRDHKEELKTLGGKWNAKLTDKSTQEQFGGWIFPTTKQEQVKKWLASVGNSVVPTSTPQITPRVTTPRATPKSSDSPIERIEMGIQRIEGIIKSLDEVPQIVEVLKGLSVEFKNIKKEYTTSAPPLASSDFEEEDEEDGPPPKRLLGKK